ncbi:TetR/AcrR family transcriptional regulator C-terminal domain-containing protein [Amycolatopsis anabasis]|uniref:TetR/AcrR family transcriptional regulator C-terminal domain-containing protein n=1 Tax=Amycolatopsis anabasis TaxID=1840409 RepID=UPI00131AE60A|nr:TetR/AcrR family transcriptional regulator C-terminal domain-containing protein [Amycolatopsis anabasis]
MSTNADGTRTRRKTALRVETVARAALALVDSGGLESLTMRRLAVSLDVQLPTIYRLFDNKQALLDEMAETVLGGVLARVREDGEADWAGRAAALARAMRETLLAQRDGARIVGGTYTAKQHTLTLAETMLASMRDAGFPGDTALRANTTIFSFVLGEVLEQQGATGGEIETLTASLRGGRYPCLAAAPVELIVDFDARFDFGLRILLAGLSAELA